MLLFLKLQVKIQLFKLLIIKKRLTQDASTSQERFSKILNQKKIMLQI